MNDANYDDIINLPHYVSKKRARMPVSDRAAQFASFAALFGHSSDLDETERQTNAKFENSENFDDMDY